MKKSQITCPFCGVLSAPTKEHVWAKWMHKSAGAKELLSGSHGEQFVPSHETMVRDSSGRYEAVSGSTGKLARLLPQVTVNVCAKCNNGWMETLESAASRLVGPFIFDHGVGLRLSALDLRNLASWVTKTWMSYALTRPRVSNPFTDDEYRSMARDHLPFQRSAIWIFHCHSPAAEVGIGIASSLLTTNGVVPELDKNNDNVAFAYMAVSSIVFYMVLSPEGMPEDGRAAMVPAAISDRGVRPIWPATHGLYFPTSTASHLTFANLYDAPVGFAGAIGLQVEGKTHEEIVTEATARWNVGSS